MSKTYKVYEAEDKISAKGNAYKKLVLQEPDASYPVKGVTMFANHPLFEDIAPGQTVELEISEEDSGTPNPKAPGKNFINRTVVNPGAQKSAPRQEGFQPTIAEVYNMLNLKIIPMLVAIQEATTKKKNPYPEYDETNDSSPF